MLNNKQASMNQSYMTDNQKYSNREMSKTVLEQQVGAKMNLEKSQNKIVLN